MGGLSTNVTNWYKTLAVGVYESKDNVTLVMRSILITAIAKTIFTIHNSVQAAEKVIKLFLEIPTHAKDPSIRNVSVRNTHRINHR